MKSFCLESVNIVKLFGTQIAFVPGASLVDQTVKNLACNRGNQVSIIGLGRSPREGNGNPLWYSCLENPMDRRAWKATAHGVARVRHDLATKPPPVTENSTTQLERRLSSRGSAGLPRATVSLSCFGSAPFPFCHWLYPHDGKMAAAALISPSSRSPSQQALQKFHGICWLS